MSVSVSTTRKYEDDVTYSDWLASKAFPDWLII